MAVDIGKNFIKETMPSHKLSEPVVKLTKDKGAPSDHCHPRPSFKWFSPIQTIAPTLASRSTPKTVTYEIRTSYKTSWRSLTNVVFRYSSCTDCKFFIQLYCVCLYLMPTSDVPLLGQVGNTEEIPSLSLAGRQGLTPGQDGVQVKLVTRLQLLVWFPESLTTDICQWSSVGNDKWMKW